MKKIKAEKIWQKASGAIKASGNVVATTHSEKATQITAPSIHWDPQGNLFAKNTFTMPGKSTHGQWSLFADELKMSQKGAGRMSTPFPPISPRWFLSMKYHRDAEVSWYGRDHTSSSIPFGIPVTAPRLVQRID